MADFMQQWQSWVVMTETVLSTDQMHLPSDSTEIICQPLVWSVLSTYASILQSPKFHLYYFLSLLACILNGYFCLSFCIICLYFKLKLNARYQSTSCKQRFQLPFFGIITETAWLGHIDLSSGKQICSNIKPQKTPVPFLSSLFL